MSSSQDSWITIDNMLEAALVMPDVTAGRDGLLRRGGHLLLLVRARIPLLPRLPGGAQVMMVTMMTVTCHVSRVMCHVSCVTCHVSCVTCHVSCVMCHVSCVMCDVSCVTCHVSCVTCHAVLQAGPGVRAGGALRADHAATLDPQAAQPGPRPGQLQVGSYNKKPINTFFPLRGRRSCRRASRSRARRSSGRCSG